MKSFREYFEDVDLKKDESRIISAEILTGGTKRIPITFNNLSEMPFGKFIDEVVKELNSLINQTFKKTKSIDNSIQAYFGETFLIDFNNKIKVSPSQIETIEIVGSVRGTKSGTTLQELKIDNSEEGIEIKTIFDDAKQLETTLKIQIDFRYIKP